MDYQNVIKDIRSLMESPGSCSDFVSDYLYKQKCLYLLTKITNNNSDRYSLYLDTNKMIQEFRFLYCKEILKRLDNIPYAIIKGAVLSNSIYGKPFYRLSGDIDILVAPKYLNEVTEILTNEGFTQGLVIDEEIKTRERNELLYYKLYTHQLATFQKKTDFLLSPFVTVDVNFDIIWGEGTKNINIENFLNHTEITSVFGIKVRKLSPVYEFISMCMHHYKDMNSIYLLYKKGYSFYEFLDIYYYLINQKINENTLNEVARYYNVAQYIYYCIYWTYTLFGDERLIIYLDLLESSEGIDLLNCFGLNDSEKHMWNIPFLDRIFKDNFRKCFVEHLSEADWQKIVINMKYLSGKQIAEQ